MYRLGFMGTKDLHGFIFLWGERRVNLLWPFSHNDSVTKGRLERALSVGAFRAALEVA